MGNSLFVFARNNRLFTRAILIFASICLFVAWILPALSGIAYAGQLTSRSLTLSSGIPSATGVTWTYSFTIPTGTQPLQSIKFVVCTRVTGTVGLASTSATTGCTAPGTGNLVNQGTQQGSLSGSWTNTTGFTRTTSTTGNCAPGNNVLCVTRTQAANETNTSSTRTIAWNTQTNPSTANTAFYVGIYTYSDTAYATPVDAGSVASAVVQTLQVNAQVAETLNFCTGSTTVDSDSSGTVAGDCTTVSGTSVNLGTLDSSKINITPETTDCTPADCGKNAVAMVRSNALNGTVIYYDSIQQTGSNHKGTLRINGQNCNATADNSSSDTTDNTDQCFNVRTTQAAFSTTTERFGMTVAGINCGSTTSYVCTGTATANLVRDAAYDGDGTNTYQSSDADQITGPTTNGYAWDESGAATQIATSASSSVKQVDDEALILKFAAHPLITTPFGSYQAQADFIAVSTY